MKKSLQEYLKNPIAEPEKCDFINSPEVLAEFRGLLSFNGKIYWYKKIAVKRIIKLLKERLKLNDRPLTFDKTFKVKAFMNDNGSLTISRGCLFRLSTVEFVVIFAHELAHLWLASKEDYGELKALNKEFVKTFCSINDFTPLTPIEIYAVGYSISILSQLKGLKLSESVAKRLQENIDIQNKKLNEYQKKIKNLPNGEIL